MPEIQIESLNDLSEQVTKIMTSGGKFWWRGVKDAQRHKLVPGIFREKLPGFCLVWKRPKPPFFATMIQADPPRHLARGIYFAHQSSVHSSFACHGLSSLFCSRWLIKFPLQQGPYVPTGRVPLTSQGIQFALERGG